MSDCLYVYLVYEGCSVLGVYLTMEVAEQALAAFKTAPDYQGFDEFDIVVRPVIACLNT